MTKFKLRGALEDRRCRLEQSRSKDELLSYSLSVVFRTVIRMPLSGDGTCDGRLTIDGRELMIVEVTESGLSASSGAAVTG